MSEKNYNNSIVKKAWGYEYLTYKNDKLAIWFLSINPNEETSFHCHCKKNTGLIVLDGLARISFINNGITLKGLDKVQIFKGRFHSTKNLSKKPLAILEVEAPEDKTDLVRLKDKYGRAGKPYEGIDHFIEKSTECLSLNIEKQQIFHSNCVLSIDDIADKTKLMGRDFEEVFVFLDGGIVSSSGQQVANAGDVIASHNLDILLQGLDLLPNTKVLSIKRNDI